MRKNVGFSNMFVLSLALSLLCINSDLPITTFGKDFDDDQRYSVAIKTGGKTVAQEMNFKQCWHRNITFILKTFEDMMTTNKFFYLFDFTSVNAMSLRQKLDYVSTPDQHLKAVGKFSCAVLKHGVSTTIEDKTNIDPKSKFASQLMLMQHFKSSITFYKRNKLLLKGLLADGKRKAGRFKKIFFIKKAGEYRNHLSMVGWKPFHLVITEITQYWMPPLADKMEEVLEDDDEEEMEEWFD